MPIHLTPWPEPTLAPQRRLALPIAQRPLFPSFYKAVVIRNPQVIAAVKKTMKRSQPVFEEELTNFAHLEPVASKANVTHNYLNWLTQIPWATSRHVT